MNLNIWELQKETTNDWISSNCGKEVGLDQVNVSFMIYKYSINRF